jgi:ribosomal protein S4E
MGRIRCRWEDNNKMNLQEVGFGFMDWIELAQDRDRWRVLVNAVMNFWVP